MNMQRTTRTDEDLEAEAVRELESLGRRMQAKRNRNKKNVTTTDAKKRWSK